MSLVAAPKIRHYAKEFGLIEPFVDHKVTSIIVENITLNKQPNTHVNKSSISRKKIISYGLQGYGYDIRLAPEYKIFTNVHNGILDPMEFDPNNFVSKEGPFCIIPPNSFILGRSIEYIRMPKNWLAICLGKSTYARNGLIANFTPFENGWHGHVTIEISNTTPLPAKVYANWGIAQVIFLEGEETDIIYGKDGKYQGQTGITPAKM